MTTPIGRNKGDRIEWTLEEKNLLYYVCKSPELKDERWTKKWAIFDMVRRFTNGPQRAQRSHDALTSAWKRYQRDCNNGGALLDPWWEDEDWLRGMVDDTLLPLRSYCV